MVLMLTKIHKKFHFFALFIVLKNESDILHSFHIYKMSEKKERYIYPWIDVTI